MDLGQHQNMPTPLTPPQSATDTKAPAASENTNPFITETEHSPAPTPHVTNPFEMNEQANKAAATYLAAQNGGASTNPFENETSIGASDQSGTYPIHLNNARTLRSSFDSSKEDHQPSNVDNNGNRINRQSAELMRRFSSRRNALHGPF
ncbi:hypothetical protein BDF20DRAFT_863605 [Mycotypha africana]|uniref:uncharacterized protein n=1 Tax=Mycotypha africana TaxID=64632 RepID=UPI0023000193|nr:uncharacterized protein BDF20DRAFT_863605 [Mycotypha africana]KAI8981855.1 hypothetical protein BDF20DRAFT_863605 [Mycotypha africana]